MPDNRPFKVVIFSSGAGPVIGRLIRRIHREIPEARVAGVLLERRPGKPLGKRVSAFVQKLRHRDFVRYAAVKVVDAGIRRLAALGTAALHCIHAARPPVPAAEDLVRVCDSSGCRLLVTSDCHNPESLEFVRSLNPDLGLVYGTRILKPALFTIPRLGSINIHKRKVPDYRGGGPVGLWEMLDGQPEIGVTVHEVVEQLDAGAVINSAAIPIDPFDTLTTLALKAHVVANDLLVSSVEDYARGTVRRQLQQGNGRMFKNPSPQQLACYEKQLASERPAFRPVRSRSAFKLLARSLLGAPVAMVRNWKRRILGDFPVMILFHHVVTDRPHRLGISTAHFLKQVEFLRRHYRIVSLAQASEMLRNKNVKAPTVVLTFDDGYRDNFLTLRAIREQIDLPMTLFVSTDHLSSGRGFDHDITQGIPDFSPLTWDQLRQLHNEGFEIGSHSRTHFDCGSSNLSALEREIAGSREVLELHLGRPVEFFSFPFGLPQNISPEAMKLASETYKVVSSAYGGSNFSPAAGAMRHLRRWHHPNDLWELELLLQSLLELEPKDVNVGSGVPESHRTQAA